MAGHFKTFMAILMAVLALGLGQPQTACAAGMSETAKSCCSTATTNCQDHPDQACHHACAVARAQSLDKQAPARTTLTSLHGIVFLFSFAPTPINHLVPAAVAHRRELTASPPFGGNPPQAMLRLWLI